MNKKVLVYLCCLILFISVSLNIFFISYSNNVKRSTNLIINNMVNLVENKYSGVVVEDIIKELNSSVGKCENSTLSHFRCKPIKGLYFIYFKIHVSRETLLISCLY